MQSRGRTALLDLVQCPTDEARLAFPGLMRRVLERAGGRLAWAGSADQQFIGTGSEDAHDVFISEFPNLQACDLALSERSALDSEQSVGRLRSFVATPWPVPMRWMARTLFGLRGLRGGGPPPYDRTTEKPPRFEETELGFPEFGPTREQFEVFHGSDLDRRVVMVNFLHFRERARYSDGGSDGSQSTGSVRGQTAYERYGANTMKIVGHLGGRPRWFGGRVRSVGEGPEQSWNQVALMQYPSRAHFIGMVRDAAYRSGTHHRDAGLERTELIACTSHPEYY